MWWAKRKIPIEVLSLLKLDKAGSNLFLKSRWKTWVTYVNNFDRTDPDKAMASALATHYGDDVLSGMIEAAKLNAKTSSTADKLEAGLMKTWIASGHSTDEVFKLLILDDARDKLIDNPQLRTLISYVKRYSHEFPDESTTVIAILIKHYGGAKLARIIEHAKMVDSSEKMAEELQVMQFARWLDQDKSKGDIAALLFSSRTVPGSQRTTKVEQTFVKKYAAFVEAHSWVA